MNNCTDTTEELTYVGMTEEDVQLFVQFRQYQDVFSLLLKGGVFENIRNSQITINSDNTGIFDIKILTTLYRRMT